MCHYQKILSILKVGDVSKIFNFHILKFIFISFLAVLGSRQAFAQEWTSPQSISQFLYEGTADLTYITAPAGWGSSTCPAAVYAYMSSAVVIGRKQMWAILLSAKATGAKVQFQGTCYNSNYFVFTYVIVH